MNLDRVTITGADDSIHPERLIAISEKYPFVEWGILMGSSSAAHPRFPSASWIDHFRELAVAGAVRASLHLCGRPVRDLLLGFEGIKAAELAGFGRLQLNFHAEALHYSLQRFCEALAMLCENKREPIFQIDGRDGADLLYAVDKCGPHSFDPVALFDCSHGAGVLPAEWPQIPNHRLYYGYAGGLGPDNLAEQIEKIATAAGDTRIWIDMETRVRSDNDRTFDLYKVEQCLAIAAEFVTR